MDFIITSIVWILALYGLIEIFKIIILECTKLKVENDGIFIIIAAKNQENKIEGFIRTFLFRWIYGKEEYINEIYVVDLDSNDNTEKILENLKSECKQIKVCDWQTCKQLIEKKD